MPGPDVSDRERLLRLIDGGPEVTRELQRERETPPVKEEVKPQPAAAAQAAPIPSAVEKSKKPSISEAQKVRLAQASLAALVVIFAIYSLTDLMKTKNLPHGVVPVTAAASVENGGLRLVGVDWGDTPVALLEDTVTGKTYFVRKNQSVLGARVRDIQKDHVSVSLRGKTVEIR